MKPDVGMDRGVAVVWVLLVSTLLSAVLAAVVAISATDLEIASAFERGLQVTYAAEAGLSRALVDLDRLPDWSSVLDGTVRSTVTDGLPEGVRTVPGGVSVDLDLVLSLATCGSRPPCTDGRRTAVSRVRPWGPNNPRWRLFAYGPTRDLFVTLPAGPPGLSEAAPPPMYVVVVVADDPAETDGNPDRDEVGTAPGAGVVRLRAEAFGRRGAHYAVEALVARPGPSRRLRVLQKRSGSSARATE